MKKTIIQTFRSLLMIALLACSATSVLAQMSDTEILAYVKKQSDAGVSQTKIAQDLVRRGVSVQKLQELKAMYENADGQGGGDASGISGVVSNRERKANGEERAEMPAVASGKKIFGHDIFRDKKLSFEPNMNIPTPSDYILGPGDEVILDIYGSSQHSLSVKVSPDGSIVIPEEGVFQVAGLTAQKAQAKVANAIGGHYANSVIKLTVGQTRTVIVNVLGEVVAPGTYTLSAFSTVFNALYLSGGVTEIGTLRDVQVSRNGKVIAHIDIYDFIVNGNLKGNIMLQDNDVIRVSPYKNLVQIEGKVRRPMYYELKEDESLKTLLDYAGGFTGDAYRTKVRVERKSEEGLSVHNVAEKEQNSFLLMDGDVAVVGDIVQRYKNTVTVEGAVFRPGKYKMGEDVTSIMSLVEQAGGLLENAITTRAVLHRMKEDRTLETQSVALDKILAGIAPDIMLKNEDVLYVASTSVLDSLRVLTIQGEVFTPGVYPYSENEKIEDLIIRAGGLLESASLVNVEVARRVTTAEDNADGKRMAKIFNLSMQNGLVIEGDTDFHLEPYDIVTVHKSPDYQEQRVVSVIGEVKYAGAFVLSSKEERLSDLIKRAGGLTANAFVGGIQLTRRVTQEEMDIKQLKLDNAVNKADSAAAMEDLEKDTYLVGVDLEEALDHPGGLSDIVLKEGDVISIPQLTNTVKIRGEVLFANTVAYNSGKKAKYYINQAGGVNKDGSKRHAYIVYANGQVSRARWHKPQPGSEVVVPEKIKHEINPQQMSMWLSIASTMATVATVISVILK